MIDSIDFLLTIIDIIVLRIIFVYYSNNLKSCFSGSLIALIYYYDHQGVIFDISLLIVNVQINQYNTSKDTKQYNCHSIPSLQSRRHFILACHEFKASLCPIFFLLNIRTKQFYRKKPMNKKKRKQTEVLKLIGKRFKTGEPSQYICVHFEIFKILSLIRNSILSIMFTFKSEHFLFQNRL
ncbi:Hypothetical_protein [Hexamita inflata]|uniref:Hypothetical_protein n=1 Tax=Hexamita inflata TaxID=28002 RepID=A0AA86QC29_9EUKA|nr:Hypothetical protein HINF_LOCUS44134 [Hexamita inflata]